MPDDPNRDGNWSKRFVGIVIPLLAAGGGIVALLTYTIGPRPVPSSVPSSVPYSVSPPAPIPVHSLTGIWSYTMRSNVSGNTYKGSMHLTQDNTAIGGEMDDPGGRAGATTGLTGSYVDGKLKLSRSTGMNTSQEFELDGTGQQLMGRFNNIGDYPDSGTIEINR